MSFKRLVSHSVIQLHLVTSDSDVSSLGEPRLVTALGLCLLCKAIVCAIYLVYFVLDSVSASYSFFPNDLLAGEQL